MKKITSTQRISIFACVVLLVAVSGYVYFFKLIESGNKALNESKVNLLSVEKKIQTEQEKKLLLETTQTDRDSLYTHFVPVEDPTPFLELVETLARETGIDLVVESLKEMTGTESSTSSLKKITIMLSVEGEWSGLYEFISLLEQLPYSATIVSTVFSYDEKEKNGIWSGMIELQSSAL
jgi:hypothetical protein